MIPIIEKPESAQEYDAPIIRLDDYSKDEQIEYWYKKRDSVKYMHDYSPKSFEKFVKLYGADVAEEILATT